MIIFENLKNMFVFCLSLFLFYRFYFNNKNPSPTQWLKSENTLYLTCNIGVFTLKDFSVLRKYKQGWDFQMIDVALNVNASFSSNTTQSYLSRLSTISTGSLLILKKIICSWLTDKQKKIWSFCQNVYCQCFPWPDILCARRKSFLYPSVLHNYSIIPIYW